MPDFTAVCVNRNNTGSLNHADLPGAAMHLYTEPEVPFLHLYWLQEVFNHWAPVKSSVADITFSGLWFPFESLPLVTNEEHYRVVLKWQDFIWLEKKSVSRKQSLHKHNVRGKWCSVKKTDRSADTPVTPVPSRLPLPLAPAVGTYLPHLQRYSEYH